MRGNGLPKMTKTRQQEWEEAVELGRILEEERKQQAKATPATPATKLEAKAKAAVAATAEEDAAEARIARAAAASEPITIAEDIASFTQTRVGARTCALSSPPPTGFRSICG